MNLRRICGYVLKPLNSLLNKLWPGRTRKLRSLPNSQESWDVSNPVFKSLSAAEHNPKEFIRAIISPGFSDGMGCAQQLSLMLDKGLFVSTVKLFDCEVMECEVGARFKDIAEARQLVAALCFLRLKARTLSHHAQVPIRQLLGGGYAFGHDKLIAETHHYLVSLKAAVRFVKFRKATRGESAWEAWELQEHQVLFYEWVLLALLRLQLFLCGELHLLDRQALEELGRLAARIGDTSRETISVLRRLFKSASLTQRFTAYHEKAQQVIVEQVNALREAGQGGDASGDARARALREAVRAVCAVSPEFAVGEDGAAEVLGAQGRPRSGRQGAKRQPPALNLKLVGSFHSSRDPK